MQQEAPFYSRRGLLGIMSASENEQIVPDEITVRKFHFPFTFIWDELDERPSQTNLGDVIESQKEMGEWKTDAGGMDERMRDKKEKDQIATEKVEDEVSILFRDDLDDTQVGETELIQKYVDTQRNSLATLSISENELNILFSYGLDDIEVEEVAELIQKYAHTPQTSLATVSTSVSSQRTSWATFMTAIPDPRSYATAPSIRSFDPPGLSSIRFKNTFKNLLARGLPPIVKRTLGHLPRVVRY